jgi:hypothetical protein
MRPDNTHYLERWRQQRQQQALHAAAEALRTFDREGQPITFAGVAQAAGVSRGWLYKSPLADEVKRLRDMQQASGVRLPAAQRSSDTSLRRRLEAAVDDNKRLRARVRRLTTELELALGALRDERVRNS